MKKNIIEKELIVLYKRLSINFLDEILKDFMYLENFSFLSDNYQVTIGTY